MATVAASVRIAKPEGSSTPPKLQIQSFQEGNKKVLFVTSELADLVKVGGLGDVSAALPRALGKRHDIRILIPGYRQVVGSGMHIKLVGKIAGYASLPSARLGRIDLDDGLIVYVIICPQLFERDGYPYGDERGEDWHDNHIRFAMLGHAAAELASGHAGIRWLPQLVHANDWPTGLVPAYMAWRGIRTPTLFTIHNLMYAGTCANDCLPELGVPTTAAATESLEFGKQSSFLKAGLSYATHITTVSRNYAREITTQEAGCGLHTLLATREQQGRLSGILNGIDDSWNPLTDPHLLRGFHRWEHDGKALHARAVASTYGLEDDGGPLFAVVSRLVHQKGIDLTIDAADDIIAAGGRIVTIGRGEAKLEAAVTALQARHPGRVAAHVGFNERDARRIYAASDFLLMPSRFEPCGLSQMYAQRLGSLPIARRTGGLVDTVDDGVNGFLFDDMELDDYLAAIHRAINVFRHPQLLQAMRRKAMASPMYWKQSVKPYDQLYRRLVDEEAVMTAAS